MQANLGKYFKTFAAVWVMIAISLTVLAEEKQQSRGSVASVNGSAVTAEDFNWAIMQIKQRFVGQGKDFSASRLSEIKKEVLEKLINRELLHQESLKNGFQVSSAEVDDQLDKLKDQFPSEAEFKNALSNIGFSEKNIKPQIRRGMEIQRFVDHRFGQQSMITEKEIKAYYNNHSDYFKQPEQVRARHILIKIDPTATEFQKAEAIHKIEIVRQLLAEGQDFAMLAKAYSEAPNNINGGDLGYFKRGQMVKPFETAAFALAPGDLSDIVETRFGYHLIKVIDKKSQTTVVYDKARDKIARYLAQQKVQELANKYVEELKRNATIERFITKDR